MSVNIATTTQPSNWWQRLTGTEPKTVVRETSTTTITNDPGGSFNLGTALRNGGIGAAIAGALGGVSLLGKVALPVIGKVATVAGLGKLALVGGAIGLATAAIPLVAPKVRDSPAAKAALLGAGIGAAAGAVLPLMPIPLGAAIGAGVGLLVHNSRNRPASTYPTYPGFQAYPGYAPVGMSGNTQVPSGLVPVSPQYGNYGGSPYGYGNGFGAGSGNGYGAGFGNGYGAGYGNGFGASYGYPSSQAAYGYGAASPHGYGMTLPMQGVAQPAAQAPVAAPVASRPAAAKAPKFKGAKTFTDNAGNVRQIGTGTIVRAARAGTRPAHAAAPSGMIGATSPQVGMSQLTSPASYLPGMASTLPFAGGSPFSAGSTGLAGYGASMAQPTAGFATGATAPTGMQPAAIPARPIA